MDNSVWAAQIFDKHARGYQEKYMDVSLYHESFNFFCEAIPISNASILELACGPGNVTRYLLEKRPDFKILGTDLAPNMLELARENNPGAGFKLMDCRNIEKEKNDYDGVVCAFAMPYLSMQEVRKLIYDIYGRLKADGLVYLSTIEGKYENSALTKGSTGDEIFMHYYPSEFIIGALENNGFKVLYQEEIETLGAGGNKVTDLVVVAKK